MMARLPLAGLVLTALVVSSLAMSLAHAQTASRSTYVKLLSVQKMWEEEDYEAAMSELRELVRKTAKNPYDHAVAHQYLAQTAIFAGKPDAARDALAVALELPELPLVLVTELKLFYGQLVLGDGDYELARRMLEDWYLHAEGKKPPPAVFSLAYANFQTGNLVRSQSQLEEAIAGMKRARDSWYRLYYQVLFEQQKFRAAEMVLYRLLNENSEDESYWRLLVNHHLQQNEGREALSAMAIAFQQGLIETPEDLARLVSLYGYVDVPEKAARLLEQFLNDEAIAESPATLKQLGDLWLIARERSQALKYLQRAAAAAPDGKTYELLGGLYFEDENWAQAYQQFAQALDLGDIENEPRTHLLAGVSAMRAGMTREARSALNEARKSNPLRAQADGLLRQLDDS